VDEALQARLRDLSREFFAQDLETKLRIRMARAGRAWRVYRRVWQRAPGSARSLQGLAAAPVWQAGSRRRTRAGGTRNSPSWLARPSVGRVPFRPGQSVARIPAPRRLGRSGRG
jgi:isopenicillin N synthase-like dioxygenase